jgi:hypothetical protein
VTCAFGPIRQWSPDGAGMFGAGPNHGVFHDDPVAPDPDDATGLTDEAGAMQDAHARSDRDVAAQRRIRCHPGRRIDRWTPSSMLDQHRLAILSPRRVGDRAAVQAAPAVVSYPTVQRLQLCSAEWICASLEGGVGCARIVPGDASIFSVPSDGGGFRRIGRFASRNVGRIDVVLVFFRLVTLETLFGGVGYHRLFGISALPELKAPATGRRIFLRILHHHG